MAVWGRRPCRAELAPLAFPGKASAEQAPLYNSRIFQRLTHQIPHYRGVLIGDRVQLVGDDAPADRVIQPDGRLVPAPL